MKLTSRLHLIDPKDHRLIRTPNNICRALFAIHTQVSELLSRGVRIITHVPTRLEKGARAHTTNARVSPAVVLFVRFADFFHDKSRAFVSAGAPRGKLPRGTFTHAWQAASASGGNFALYLEGPETTVESLRRKFARSFRTCARRRVITRSPTRSAGERIAANTYVHVRRYSFTMGEAKKLEKLRESEKNSPSRFNREIYRLFDDKLEFDSSNSLCQFTTGSRRLREEEEKEETRAATCNCFFP